MKQVKLRSMLLAALVAVLAAGVVLFCVRYVVRGGQWAAFPANDHAYQEGRLALGQVLDRNGLVLYDGASGTWAEDGSIRRATLHAVGDRDDNISTSAKAALRQRLVGFDPLTGTSAGGHKVYLTIDAELNAAALDALNGRKGAVAVYNYRTGDVLCMVSSPTFDPADPPEIRDGDSRYDGVYLNRVLSSTFAPGSIFKLVTTAAALEQLPGEAGARRHAAAKLRDLVRDEHAHALMLPQHVIAPHGLLQRDRRVKAGWDDAAEIQIAQLRQQQIVHLVEAALTDLQIAAPVQIIQNIRHCRTSGHYSRSCKSVTIIHKSRPKRKEGGRKKCLSFSEVLQPINLLTLWGIYAMLMPERRQHRTIGWNCQTPCKGADF